MARSKYDTDSSDALRDVLMLMQLHKWTEARIALHALAVAAPAITRYRALLAYARGHEAALAGDLDRAHEEWRRALTLDPSMKEAAAEMKRQRRRRRSFIEFLRGGTR
jgi:Tfp pilus assembly protein PilF